MAPHTLTPPWVLFMGRPRPREPGQHDRPPSTTTEEDEVQRRLAQIQYTTRVIQPALDKRVADYGEIARLQREGRQPARVFNLGQRVRLRSHQGKLAPSYLGPFTVLGEHYGSYRLADDDGVELSSLTLGENLAAYDPADPEVGPEPAPAKREIWRVVDERLGSGRHAPTTYGVIFRGSRADATPTYIVKSEVPTALISEFHSVRSKQDAAEARQRAKAQAPPPALPPRASARVQFPMSPPRPRPKPH